MRGRGEVGPRRNYEGMSRYRVGLEVMETAYTELSLDACKLYIRTDSSSSTTKPNIVQDISRRIGRSWGRHANSPSLNSHQLGSIVPLNTRDLCWH